MPRYLIVSEDRTDNTCWDILDADDAIAASEAMRILRPLSRCRGIIGISYLCDKLFHAEKLTRGDVVHVFHSATLEPANAFIINPLPTKSD